MGPQGQQMPPQGQAPAVSGQQQAIARIYDVTAGKYDLTVKSGPSYTTMREQTREELVSIIQAQPESAAILGPMYLRNCDWPGADEAADKIEQGGVPPEVQAEMEQMRQQLAENDVKAQELAIKSQELELKAYEAETDRIRAEAERAFGGATNPLREVA